MVAAGYAAHRPGYPSDLYPRLARLAPSSGLAWDCGAGSGQAARGLADHFARVEATDASEDQVAAARPHPGVTYRVALAHESGLDDASVDLVLVGQALHWFPLRRFYQEVRRVARPGGVFAALTYGLMRITPAVDAVVDRLYYEDLAAHWPPERRHVDQAYANLPFPFEPLPFERTAMKARWSLPQLVGYLGTWSALARCRRETGEDPLAECLDQLSRAWGDAEMNRVTWPLTVLCGQVSAPTAGA